MTNNKPIDPNLKGDPTSRSEVNTTFEAKPSLVPKGFTIGLAIFSFFLSVGGYVFRYIYCDSLTDILRHAAVLVPAFVIGIPVLFWLGALIMNKIKGMHIQRRNALTLGWLISCVTILWLMGTYS